MEYVTIMRTPSIHALKRDIEKNLASYESEEAFPDSSEYKAQETSIPLTKTRRKIALPDEAGNIHEVENCLFASERYSQLTPQQAGDKRVWVYATHVTFFKYVQKRWPMPQQKLGEKGDDFTKRKIRHVEAHYFAESNRDIIRGNAISRLWWMGYIAKRSSHGQKVTLDILLKKSDVRANILERPNLNMSSEIFDQIISLLKKEDGLFQRTHFRDFMVQLNRIGGMRALNALPADAMAQLLGCIKDDVIKQAK